MSNINDILDIAKLKKEVVELTVREHELNNLIKRIEGRYNKEEVEKLRKHLDKTIEYRKSIEVLVDDFIFWEERFVK